jgi:hypothetical protein
MMGFDMSTFLGWRSVSLWYGARGPQLIDGPTAGALDAEPGVFTFAQLAAATATADFMHCKP